MRIFARNLLTEHGFRPNQILTFEGGVLRRIAAGRDSEADHIFDLVLPGFINTHSHAFQWAFAGQAEYRTRPDDSFWSWRQAMYEAANGMSAEQLGRLARQLYARMLEAGYSWVAEFHYVHHQENGTPYSDPAHTGHILIEAAQSVGIGICLLPVLYQYSGFGRQAPLPEQRRFISDDGLYGEILGSLRARWQGQPGVVIGMAPHSLRAVDVERLPQQLEAWHQPGMPIHIHIAEQPLEVEACVQHYGRRPVALLSQHCPIDETWTLVHATHLDASEIASIVRAGAIVSLCPTTEANLGDGVFQLSEYDQLGGHWSIGSDSHVCLNPAEELRWLEYGQRLRSNRRCVYASEQQPNVAVRLVLEAIRSGRQSLGLPTTLWPPDHLCDLVAFDGMDWRKDTRPEQALSQWLFSGRPVQPTAVFANGLWRVWEGKHIERPHLDIEWQRLS